MIVEGFMVRVDDVFTNDILKNLYIPKGKEVTLEFGGKVIGHIVGTRFVPNKGIYAKIELILNDFLHNEIHNHHDNRWCSEAASSDNEKE